MLHLHQPVILQQDMPEHNLKAGMEGWVIDVLDGNGKDYEVEFSDKSGNTIYIGPIPAKAIKPKPKSN